MANRIIPLMATITLVSLLLSFHFIGDLEQNQNNVELSGDNDNGASGIDGASDTIFSSLSNRNEESRHHYVLNGTGAGTGIYTDTDEVHTINHEDTTQKSKDSSDNNGNDEESSMRIRKEMQAYIRERVEERKRNRKGTKKDVDVDEENLQGFQSIFATDGSFLVQQDDDGEVDTVFTKISIPVHGDAITTSAKSPNCTKWAILTPALNKPIEEGDKYSTSTTMNTRNVKGSEGKDTKITSMFKQSMQKLSQKIIREDGWCTLLVGKDEIQNDDDDETEIDASAQELYYTAVSGQTFRYPNITQNHKKYHLENNILERKNYGYLVAIAHGAQFILDLDEYYTMDDSLPREDSRLLPVNNIMNVSVAIQGRTSFNPYPLMMNPNDHYGDLSATAKCASSKCNSTKAKLNATIANRENTTRYAKTWPRGFPGLNMFTEELKQDSISNNTSDKLPSPSEHIDTYEYTKGKIAFNKNIGLLSSSPSLPSNIYRVGVIQLVPDEQRDEGLLHFFRSHNTIDSGSRNLKYDRNSPTSSLPLLVPSHSYSPYNMISTIHSYDAFFAMLLPITLPKRISDIARSYFAQCLFPDIGLRVVYSPSKFKMSIDSRLNMLNVQDLKHKLDGEIDMMVEVDSMLDFLSGWDSPHATLPARMEHLWKALCIQGYISLHDVESLQLWLESLHNIGYTFPSLSKRRYQNVAVMGHFNYAKSPSQVDDVIFWTQKYREWFQSIVVTGPFSTQQVNALEKHSIMIFKGDRDDEGGYFQVTDNLKNTLNYFKNSTKKIESVMYFHDDGMINMTELSQGRYPFPTNEIIGNYRDQRYDMSYADVRNVSVEDANKFSYRIFPNSTVCAYNKTQCHPTVNDLYKKLPLYHWGMTTKGYCSKAQQSLAQDKEMFPYHEADGSLLFSSFTQSDFIHIPIQYADEFSKLASLFLKHGVIHECAWGTIVDLIRKKLKATVRLTMLCTSWGPKRRGKKGLIERCMRDRVDYGVFHPYKIGYEENGYQGYDWAMDLVQDRHP